MTTITVKNIPEKLYTQLKTAAKINRRSVNSEIIICLERQLYSHRPSMDEMLEKARRMRKLTKNHPLSEQERLDAKEWGRP